MKTLDQIIRSYKSETLDGRDISRLSAFVPEERWPELGISFKDDADKGTHVPTEFNRDNVIDQLRRDVEFGFEKALNKRGLSAGMMYDVVSMWNWVLEDGLENFDEYAHYGLPLFKATAIKYGFPNPIGDDEGDEDRYSTWGDY